jgi:selenocysteine lyase/cysteine desulfurase
VNVLIDGDASRLAQDLREKRIVVSVRDGVLRVSMSFFNNEEDLERLLDALPR